MPDPSEDTLVIPPTRYSLESSPFASGAMGEVFEAHDRVLNRKVAVKTLKRPFADSPDALRMFREEAQITGQLQHPNIPPVYDLGALPDGRPFLVMKLIKGQTLADILKTRPDPAHDRPRFLHVFEQICQAVGFAHERSVIHRDLKPSNVMVGSFGEVQIMDWGLAKVLTGAPAPAAPAEEAEPHLTRIETEDRDPTHAGTLKGTVAFMPPEQARGEIHLVDRRSDVFALGALLCVVLTGEPPYTGASVSERDLAQRAGLSGMELVKLAARMGLLEGAFDRLDACGADPELTALAKRCLSPKQDDRHADARAVAAAVAAYREAVEARAEQDRLARNAAAIDLLLGQCEDALRGDDAGKAVVFLEQAESRAVDGGGDFATRLDRCRRELAMLKELDRIDDLRWTVTEGKLTARFDLTLLLSDAFRRFGVHIESAPTEDSAREINASFMRDRLLAGLDAWFAAIPADDLLAVLRAADPDAYRHEVRTAIRAADTRRLRELCRGPEALDQPVRFAIALGEQHLLPEDRRERILLAAQQRQSGALPILMAICNLAPIKHASRALERAGWARAALAVRPTNAVAWNHLGTALSDLRFFAEAIAAYRRAIGLDPKFVWAHSNLGVVLSEVGDGAGAVAASREAIRLAPDQHVPHNNLGVTLEREKDLDGALAAYRRCIALNPDFSLAHHNLGNVLKSTGDLDGAVAAFRRALQIEPASAKVHRSLGSALYRKGDFEGAVAAYRKALRLDPRSGVAHYNLGVALQATGDLAKAIAAYTDAIRYEPRSAAAHFNLAVALQVSGDLDRAIAAYAEARRLDPGSPRRKRALAAALKLKAERDAQAPQASGTAP